MHDKTLPVIDNIIKPRFELIVRSITESTGQRPQHPYQRHFSENTETTVLMSASSRIGLNTNQDGKDETRNVENSEDGKFPAKKIQL